MFSLLSEPLSSSQVGPFKKVLQRKDLNVCQAPFPLPVSSSSPTSNPGRIFTKTRGMTGSSVLPVVYRIFKSLKLSRKKVWFFFFNKVQFVLVYILHCFVNTSGIIWCVLPSQFFFTHSSWSHEGSLGRLCSLRSCPWGCRRFAAFSPHQLWTRWLRSSLPSTRCRLRLQFGSRYLWASLS